MRRLQRNQRPSRTLDSARQRRFLVPRQLLDRLLLRSPLMTISEGQMRSLPAPPSLRSLAETRQATCPLPPLKAWTRKRTSRVLKCKAPNDRASVLVAAQRGLRDGQEPVALRQTRLIPELRYPSLPARQASRQSKHPNSHEQNSKDTAIIKPCLLFALPLLFLSKTSLVYKQSSKPVLISSKPTRRTWRMRFSS